MSDPKAPSTPSDGDSRCFYHGTKAELVCATTRGKGTYMLKDPRDMHLIEAKSFENGVVLLGYDIKK